MSDEFDDLLDPLTQRRALTQEPPPGRRRLPVPANLVVRLYRAAEYPLRAKLLACLMKPLSPLALVAVAAGAFAGALHRGDVLRTGFVMEDVARHSNEQIHELARFVEQVNPDVLQDFADLFLDNAVGSAAFSVAAALLLMRTLQRRGSTRNTHGAAPQASPGPAAPDPSSAPDRLGPD